MIYEISSGLRVNITPWTDLCFRPLHLRLVESIGGNLPGGTMRLQTTGLKETELLANNIIKGRITIEFPEVGSPLYDIPIYTSLVYLDRGDLIVDFLCVESKDEILNFTVDKVEFSDPKKTIEHLWKGKTDIRAEYGHNNVPTLYLNDERPIDICSDFCKSYKKNTIFGYGLLGLFIKDVIGKSWSGRQEPSVGVISGLDFLQVPGKLEKFSKRLYQRSELPWDNVKEDRRPRYMTMLKRASGHAYLGQDQLSLLEANVHNSLYYGDSTPYILAGTKIGWPGYTLGDTIYYRIGENMKKLTEDTPDVLYFVHANTINIPFPGNTSRSGFSWTSELVCITKEGEIYFEEDAKDPTDSTSK